MPQFLTNLLQKLLSNDTDTQVREAINENFEQLDDHDHEDERGDNEFHGKRLRPGAIELVSQNISSADWAVEDADAGTYSQIITIPAALVDAPSSRTYNSLAIQFRDDDSDFVYPEVVYVASTQYKIIVNDNSIGLTAIYTT